LVWTVSEVKEPGEIALGKGNGIGEKRAQKRACEETHRG
jgi:hypothetical protein